MADLVRQELLSGGFVEGLLPAEQLLAAQFGATRNAVREALDALRQEGLIDRLPGVGTVVLAQKVPHGLHRLMGLAEVLREHGTVVNEVRAAGPVRPPSGVASRPRVPETGSVVYIERLRRLNGLPLSLDLTYITLDVGEPLLAADLEGQDIFALIERISGQRLGAADLSVQAVNADAHSASVLGVPRGTALLMMERLSHLDDVLSETTEDWARGSTQLADALADPDPGVRAAAIELLAELREVLVSGPEFEAALRQATSPCCCVERGLRG